MLLPLLSAVLLALVVWPAHAAPLGDSGYIAMQVPNLPRATRFFQDVMNCAPVDPDADTYGQVLLECGNGTVVSLTRTNTRTGMQAKAPVEVLSTDNAIATATWLRANHLRIVGRPQRLADSADTDEIVVTFLTPWGQPLRLVSHVRAVRAYPMHGDERLAAQ